MLQASGADLFGRGGKPGLLEWLSEGTIVFNNIQDLPVELVPKIVQLLETVTYTPVRRLGEPPEEPRPCRARIIMIAEKHQPSIERLVGHLIKVPPLRVRKADIRAQVEYYASLYCQTKHLPKPKLTPEALRRLQEYDFPSNLRELQSLVERAIVGFPFVGRLWCSICPFMIYGEVTQKLSLWLWPRQLKRWPREQAEKWGGWFLFGLFALIFLWEELWNLEDTAIGCSPCGYCFFARNDTNCQRDFDSNLNSKDCSATIPPATTTTFWRDRTFHTFMADYCQCVATISVAKQVSIASCYPAFASSRPDCTASTSTR